MWLPRRDPEHRREAKEVQDVPDAKAESMPAGMPAPGPVEEEPAAVASDGRDRRKFVAGLLTAKARAEFLFAGAGGFAGYQKYWDQISFVDVGEFRIGTRPGDASATITYQEKAFGTNIYPASYQVVQEDGRWKIAWWMIIGT